MSRGESFVRSTRTVMRAHKWWSALAAILVIGVVASVIAALVQSPPVKVTNQFVAGTPEAGSPVQLDTSLFVPQHVPAPVVLLAHGFGGTKSDVAGQARSLAQHGYLVMTYTARGFGDSGGLIHLDSLDYEVHDATLLLDYLQARPEALKTNGTLVAGVAGSSYGGALALELGATDPRIGAVAADITWNDLYTALFPNGVVSDSTGQTGSPVAGGVFKKLWAGYLFSAGFPAGTGVGQLFTNLGGNSANPTVGPSSIDCGRFAADWCSLFARVSAGAQPNTSDRALLARSSPASVLTKMTSPVLLTQGEQDSLFGLDQADANLRQLQSSRAAVQIRWRAGGHDASDSTDKVSSWQQQFLDQKLRGTSAGNTAQFLLSEPGASISASTGQKSSTTLRAENGYPAFGTASAGESLTLYGPPSQTINAPSGGVPAAVTSLPGLSGLLSSADSLGLAGGTGLSGLPGQTAVFLTQPLSEPLLVTGSSKVTLTFAAGPEVVAFASLRDVGSSGAPVLPNRLVSPIRLAASTQPRTVTVSLPWIVDDIAAGHRLAVVVATTDFSYLLPNTENKYTVSLGGNVQGGGGVPALYVPSVQVQKVDTGGLLPWVLITVIVLVACAIFLFWQLRVRRWAAPNSHMASAESPIVVDNLVKEYAGGYRAVDGVSFTLERGQVLGLLGPNGAGKTTTLRVLMGLIRPTSGDIRVFGESVRPGAPVLARLGAFIEGPGLLPHLTGRDNLELYWAASGRPREEAAFDTVLDIAGLGSSLDRKVKDYSHGMKQRLAIAQAMLGLPEVLVLDEPTNGLDPPQIAEMREVLGRYAATERSVVISSHLLAEVEQTCSHVVVMHRGRLVAAGSVADLAGSSSTQLVVDDPDRAVAVLAAAGVSAEQVPARRALEEVFLDLIDETPSPEVPV